MDFGKSKVYSTDIINDQIEESIARLWAENPNFSGLEFENSNSSALDSEFSEINNNKDALPEIISDSTTTPTSTTQTTIESHSLGLYENLQNKLWYARSEMAVALDAVLLLLENSEEQKKQSLLKTDQSFEPLPQIIPSTSTALPPEKGFLMLDNFQPSKPTDAEQISQYQLAIGGKQLQLHKAAKYLRKQNRRLKRLVLQSQSLFQGAINIREKFWVIQQHQSPTLGTQFYIPYGYSISGLRYGEQGIAKILSPEPISKKKYSSTSSRQELVEKDSNETGSGSGSGSETGLFSFRISELPEAQLTCEIVGECLSTKGSIYTKSGILFQKLDGSVDITADYDKFDLINEMLTKARSAIYSRSLFRTLQEEALLFSKGSISTKSGGNKDSVLTDPSLANNDTDINHLDILTIPLPVHGYSLVLKLCISNRTQPVKVPITKPLNEIIDEPPRRPQLENDKMDVDQPPSLQPFSTSARNTTIIRMAPDILLILSSMFLSRQYSYFKKNRFGLLSNVGKQVGLLLPALDSLECLFSVNRVDSLLRNYVKVWKNLIGEHGYFQSTVIDPIALKNLDEYYTANLTLGNKCSLLVKILGNKKILIHQAINVPVNEFSSQPFSTTVYSSIAEASECISTLVTKLLVYEVCSLLNSAIPTIMHQAVTSQDQEAITTLSSGKRLLLASINKLEFCRHPLCISGKLAANDTLVNIRISLNLGFDGDNSIGNASSDNNSNGSNKQNKEIGAVEEGGDSSDKSENFVFEATSSVKYTIEAATNGRPARGELAPADSRSQSNSGSTARTICKSFVFDSLKIDDKPISMLLQRLGETNGIVYRSLKLCSSLYCDLVDTISLVIEN